MSSWFKNEMTEKQCLRWEKDRKRGQLFYILVWGILFFGGVMLIFDVCLGVFDKHKPLLSSVDSFQAVVDIVVGVLFGWLTWRSNENRYRKYLAQESSANEISSEKVS